MTLIFRNNQYQKNVTELYAWMTVHVPRRIEDVIKFLPHIMW